MSVALSSALLGAALIVVRLLYLGCRLPVEPWWAREFLVSSVILPLVVLTMTFASIEMARAFVQAPVGEPQTLPLVAMAMVAAASAALWYGLGRALRAGPAIAAVEPPPAGAGESVDMRPAAAPGGARRVA